VRTALELIRAGVAPPVIRPEALRAAKWRAARFGLEGQLFDPISHTLMPASELVHGVLEQLRPALEAEGDWDEMCELVGKLVRDGTGATRQRAAFARAGRLEDVIDLVALDTCA
jgi:carboxylate-amine ligase